LSTRHPIDDLDADVISRDRAGGFMMQFARMGLWGGCANLHSYTPTGPSWQPTIKTTDRKASEGRGRSSWLSSESGT
jgi:hypothetical protein